MPMVDTITHSTTQVEQSDRTDTAEWVMGCSLGNMAIGANLAPCFQVMQLTVSVPSLCCSWSAMTRRKVVLTHPKGPMQLTNSQAGEVEGHVLACVVRAACCL